MYPRGYSDEDDYIQTGFLTLSQIISGKYLSRDFDKYARTAIARAIRSEAINSMCRISATKGVKRLINGIIRLSAIDMTEKEICDELLITQKDFDGLMALTRTESWHRLFEPPTYNTPHFSAIDDALSSSKLTTDDVDFVRSYIDGTTDNQKLSRKQRWSKMRKIRSKLAER